MNWKASLDKWITQEPYDDGYENYFEQLVESFTDSFYEINEIWIVYETKQIDKWVNKLFHKHTPQHSAKIIERAFNLYKL
jgi:hypothetical protein